MRKKKFNSSGMFQSYDLWVMSPPHFHCTKPLIHFDIDTIFLNNIEITVKIIYNDR